ncbi:Uncharacterized conserved protein, DUF2336 family [Methylobacterium phyllostachyos]|uniref:Uncharacterized conserved protein, DUF2336 family n=1 Tax=Methylobacterium phyllostachyos TaxID=582672 RepID=A0A1H0HZF6_9HYPH|nr:DUF2336 domain-containing protein [Methylobacterium phyllostachyos]SDO24592.1 Uncharacterized conserved protein, DUF2336 family [Methylobacterium phyllostachyos]
MIIRDFLAWTQNASASRRAEATAVLTRAYLYGNLSADQAWEAKTALLTLLDDPSPLVRRALAETCAASARTPRPLVVALACDVPEVARLVLARSPVLTDADLVDAAALGDETTRAVIAARHHLSHAVSGALAEIAEADTLVVLARNPTAKITAGRMLRMLERCGAEAPLREALLARADLPPEVRHAIGLAVAQALSGFVTNRGWLGTERCDRLRREAGERVALEACEGFGAAGIARLVAHLRTTQQLTAGLILRAVLSGRTDFAVAALSDLSGQDHAGVARALRDPRSFVDLHQRAGLPDALLPALQAALAALEDMARRSTPVPSAGLSRGIIERAIDACNSQPGAGMQPVLVLLNRYEAEAARDEAREVARAIAAEAMARETARRNAQAADAAWRAALESQRRTVFAPSADAPEVAVALDATAEPHNPVGAILDALPEQILAWYRTEEPAVDMQAKAATEAVLDGLGDSLLDHFRVSHGLAAKPDAVSGSDKAKIAA